MSAINDKTPGARDRLQWTKKLPAGALDFLAGLSNLRSLTLGLSDSRRMLPNGLTDLTKLSGLSLRGEQQSSASCLAAADIVVKLIKLRHLELVRAVLHIPAGLTNLTALNRLCISGFHRQAPGFRDA